MRAQSGTQPLSPSTPPLKNEATLEIGWRPSHILRKQAPFNVHPFTLAWHQITRGTDLDDGKNKEGMYSFSEHGLYVFQGREFE
jgi:hypothetical protein